MGSLGWGSWPFSGGGKQYKTEGGGGSVHLDFSTRYQQKFQIFLELMKLKFFYKNGPNDENIYKF